MYFLHVPEIWRRFPGLVPGLLVATEIHPRAGGGQTIERWYERARSRLRDQAEGQMPEVAAWRRVYSRMGLKPTKYRSASEALLRRFKREGDLPRLHPLVDLCNAASLAYALPVAVFDLDKVDGFIEVRPAVGTEQYLSFDGQTENPEPGEIIFADAGGHAHARRWTFRQSRGSVVEQSTETVLIVCEGVHEGAARDVGALLDELGKAIGSLFGSAPKPAILSAREPRLDFDKGHQRPSPARPLSS
jgi:DNA/RNA-binding domain of Phe-tRNA-synthetase-like protein